ncbi:RNA-directed DNA polymerase, eukaryota [Tanacetum coccineum]
MSKELQALKDNHTWILTSLPQGKLPIPCKWVFKIKCNSNGSIEKFKARLVAKGFTQKEGVDYNETVAPVAKMVTFRTFIVVAVHHNWHIAQLDINNAFLYRDLHEESYADTSLLTYKKNKYFLALVVYVDDILLTWSNNHPITHFKQQLDQQFSIKDLGNINYYLGIEFLINKQGVTVTQRKYALELIHITGVLDLKPSHIPIDPNIKLNDTDGDPLPDAYFYRTLVCKLLYLTITRPDLSYAAYCLTQFSHSPRTPHFDALIKISFPNLNRYRSKKDDVAKISTSIYVTNFPESFSAKDLFNSCKVYGHVVDSFIPSKRSKAGKRFGFVRFINVFSEERLANNLCTLILLGNPRSGSMGSDPKPAIALDDDCLLTKDLRNSLLGRVKEFASLSNLRTSLINEGSIVVLSLNDASLDFNTDGRIAWVEIEGVPFKLWSGNTFKRIASKWGELLDVDDQEDTCYHSKRLCLYTRQDVNIFENFKIIFWGKVFWIRAKEVPGWVPDFLEESNDDESDVESKGGDPKTRDLGSCREDDDVVEVPETLFEEERHSNDIPVEENTNPKENHSEDLFGIYSLLNKKKATIGEDGPSDQSPIYPPGFTPAATTNEPCTNAENADNVNCSHQEGLFTSVADHNAGPVRNSASQESMRDASESVCSGHFKKSVAPRTGGSILCLMEELVKVGQTMGYNMDGCLNNMTQIIESQGEADVNFLALQETKMETMDVFNVKMCWGNLGFDYVHSDSVGNSGGILCVWDPYSFRKTSSTVSDYFVIIRGVWLKTGNNLLIVSVYAPHDMKEKHMLWDYLTHVIHSWNGEVVIMGDFNEVRYKSDRFGSVFNVHGANAFNSFIANAGLEEVPLGGSSFTWCHKSATKMSKLDRFLISENLLITCPNITAITLERYLSDHRPILLRESRFDYGPSPFRFYHHWLEVDGFNNFVEDMWSVAPDLKSGKAKLKEDLESLDADIDKGNGTADMVTKRSEVVDSLQEINKLQTMEIAQKAKIKWCIEWDENSSFFHGMLNKRRSQLSIRGIMVDGVWIEDPLKVKCESINTLATDLLNRWTNELTLTWNTRILLLWSIRLTWNAIGAIPNGCNSSFIALIPKIPDANLVKDFRPISLIRSMYKIIAKNLANRLVGVLGDIVNEVQSAFIAERQILDGPFILNDVLQWYDILKKFGFGDKWCNWIQSCLRSSRGSIIINGSPTEEFYFQKGLKQGDPLSPFLFILVMESLHLSFQRVVDAGMFKGVQLNPSLNLSHMFYADDAVFVGQWCDDNINILTHVLDCFYWASGLRINMSKSKIMGILVADDKVKSAATKLGCLMLNTPFSYLGTKVGGSMSRTHAWEEVIDKVRSRLSRWKMKTLSIGGRLTLLKSVLGSMPIFHMSIFKAPLSVIRQLESIRSHFFNGHDSASRKASWIKWDCVLAPKEKGGLGVSSLYALNRALMFKWVWRFYSQNSSLWARVMKAIHGDDGRIGKDIKACNQSCWLNIVNEINVLKNQGINFLDFMRLKLGNGNNISFWNDNWIGGNTLKNLYPRIYALENSKQVTVCAKLADIALDASFRRKPRGGIECIQFNEMLVLMQDVSLTPISDRWIWSLEGSGDFSVASTRKAIDDKRLPVVNSKTRWIKSVPIKVNVHAWKVKLDALPTRFNISRRGIVLDSILCPICNTGVESSSHLFFTCNLARQLSCKISQWWVTPFVEVNSYGEWRSWLVSLRLSSKHKLILEGVFYVMWWHLWSYRNKLLFDSKIPLKAMIFDDIVSGSFYWCRYRCKASFSWNDWLKNPYLVSL